jgi:hypothetical protein
MNGKRDPVNSLNSRTRVSWIELNGKTVLFMEFAGASVEESLGMIRHFDSAMNGRAPGTVLLLTDVTDAAYDPSIARQWKEARSRYDAAIRASAIYGLSGLVGLAIRGFMEARLLMGMSPDNAPRIFNSGQEARAWLGEQ